MKIVINQKRILRYLLSVMILIDIFYIITQIIKFYYGYDHLLGLTRLFDLDKEGNIPTLFSTLLLMLSSFLLFHIANQKQKTNDRFILQWYSLAIVFLFLSIDESIAVHELLTTPTRNALDTSGFFYNAWIIPYGFFLILFVLFYFKFFLHLPPKIRTLFFLSGVIYITGVIGIEMIGGYYLEFFKEPNIQYAISVLFEETLEMAGIIVFIYTLTIYSESQFEDIRIIFKIKNGE